VVSLNLAHPVGDSITTRSAVQPTTTWSKDRRPNRCATSPLLCCPPGLRRWDPLEVLHIMTYINLLTYLHIYLPHPTLWYFEQITLGVWQSTDRSWRRCPVGTPARTDRRCWHRRSWRWYMTRQRGTTTPPRRTILAHTAVQQHFSFTFARWRHWPVRSWTSTVQSVLKMHQLWDGIARNYMDRYRYTWFGRSGSDSLRYQSPPPPITLGRESFSIMAPANLVDSVQRTCSENYSTANWTEQFADWNRVLHAWALGIIYGWHQRRRYSKVRYGGCCKKLSSTPRSPLYSRKNFGHLA